MLPLFDVVLLDSQAEVSKPDPAMYRLALEQARVDPQASLMVGDRLDNDVIPARRVGMRAVLLWLGATQKGWESPDPWGRAMRLILERLPAPRWDSIPPKEHPLALARCWEDLPDALTAAWAAKL
jgi:FMN phosphatase YigB (HAD superfamily)